AMKSWEIIAKVYLEFLHTLGPEYPPVAMWALRLIGWVSHH
ncbi:hypothetical protein PSA5_27630, partial [Pseudomonas syringae pv. actinidiae]